MPLDCSEDKHQSAIASLAGRRRNITTIECLFRIIDEAFSFNFWVNCVKGRELFTLAPMTQEKYFNAEAELTIN